MLMSKFFTIGIAKLALKLSRFTGKGGGSALPGLIAEKLDPKIGSKIAKSLPYGSIIITGTNGKTTTAKMLAGAMSDAGFKVVTNKAGSNLSRGVVSTLVEYSNIRGKIVGQIGVFEVDEASMLAAVQILNPKAIVVLNLFRDQLDRYGELSSTAKLVGGAIAEAKADIYLNADDPLVSTLGEYAHDNPIYYFGLDDAPVAKLAHDVTADSAHCPICGRPLDYSQNFFGHMGHYTCSQGHFKRPEVQFRATNMGLLDGAATFIIETPRNAHQPTRLNLPGVYNVYNAIAAFAVANNSGMDAHRITDSLEKAQAAFGRVEEIVVGDKKLCLLLIKNPTGFNQIIQTFLLGRKNLKILIQINDKFADGRDVSWLWDVAFEELVGQDHAIMAGGIRAADLAVRFKYAGMPIELKEGVASSLKEFMQTMQPGETGYVIPTYTAMLETRKILGGQTIIGGMWE